MRESSEHRRFAGLADFLENVPTICPHDLFEDSARASQGVAPFISRSKLRAIKKENFATRTAALIIPTVGDNFRRHETLQRFSSAGVAIS